MTSPTTLNRTLVKWFELISSSRWEAVIMFVIYLATRWFSYLRSTAIFLQVYVLAVLSREAIVNFGCVFVRLWWWSRLARNGRLLLPWSAVHTSASELTGFFLVAILIPLFPLYFITLAAFIAYTIVATSSSTLATVSACASVTANAACSTTSLPWRSGFVIYHHFLAPLIGRDPHSKPPLLVRVFSNLFNGNLTGAAPEDRNSDTPDTTPRDTASHSRSSSTEMFAASSSSRGNAIVVRTRKLTKQRSRLLLFVILILFKALSLYFVMKKFASIHQLILMVLRTCGIICSVLLGSLLFVAVGGGHSAIALCIGLEVVMAIRGIELETTRQELELWIAFVIPAIIQANAYASNLVIECALCVLRDELGPEHRLSKISLVFNSIPVNGEQAAVKLNDCMKGGGNREADRNVPGVVMTLEEADGFELRVSLIDTVRHHGSARFPNEIL